ncbi:MAG: hypothetical protein JXR48_00180 [Candidatus Delongbacteria bacterium]|nr:hypothetical protein [Candidatus Delongbacteria bacterium]
MRISSKFVESVLLLLGLLLLISCGKDGSDGNVYCAVYLGYGVYGYYDNNPGIPSTFYNGEYYKSSAGTYDFGYEDDYKYYWGTYTLTQNEGEAGGVFTDGDDGEDTYFTNYCYSSKDGGPKIKFSIMEDRKDNFDLNIKRSTNNTIPDFNTASEKVVKYSEYFGSYSIEYECRIYDKLK